MPSFDIVSEVEMNEAKNAVDNANRELETRFDFRGVDASIELNDKTIKLKALCSNKYFNRKSIIDFLRLKMTSLSLICSKLSLMSL